jgi:hypothetical protein
MADRILAFDLILGVEEVTTHRIRKFGYGDGYEQIAPDGINTKVREYNITTVPFTALDASLFRGVLDNVCTGDFFRTTKDLGLPPYIPAGSDLVRFRLIDNKYSLTSLPASDKFQFTFSLREAFSG